MNDPKIAYLGPAHTYSHLAALRLQPAVDCLLPCVTIDEVFAAIETGTADCGALPFYNSTCGLVSDTIGSILRRLRSRNVAPNEKENSGQPCSQVPLAQLCIAQSFGLEIEHCLVSWGDLQSIRQVASKQQALEQCRSWLEQNVPSAQLLPLDSSTLAIADLVDRRDLAAIVSRPAAASLKAPLTLYSIQDESDNRTEFVLVQLDSKAKSTNRTSLPNHDQGRCAAPDSEPVETEKTNHTFQYWVVERGETSRFAGSQLHACDLLKSSGIEFDQIEWQADMDYANRLYLVAKLRCPTRLNPEALWTTEIILPQPAGRSAIAATMEATCRRAWRLGADLGQRERS